MSLITFNIFLPLAKNLCQAHDITLSSYASYNRFKHLVGDFFNFTKNIRLLQSSKLHQTLFWQSNLRHVFVLCLFKKCLSFYKLLDISAIQWVLSYSKYSLPVVMCHTQCHWKQSKYYTFRVIHKCVHSFLSFSNIWNLHLSKRDINSQNIKKVSWCQIRWTGWQKKQHCVRLGQKVMNQ